MRFKKTIQGISGGSFLLLLLWAGQISAQTFSSGSTGGNGAFNPSSNTTVSLPPDGVLNYTTVNIPSGVTVSFGRNAGNTPVTMLATGDVTIAGILNLNGSNGNGRTTVAAIQPGALGAPGGFSGGQSGSMGQTNNDASAGQGPGGGTPTGINSPILGGTYGAPTTFVSLIPLFGGSGGAGSRGSEFLSGAAGGGGGGAIVIASTTKITVTGTIRANGGNGSNEFAVGCLSGSGSGGAIRLVAPEITSSGTLEAKKGTTGGCAAGAGDGRIRIEAFVTGEISSSTPSASIVNSPGPITENSVPSLINLPTLVISSVGGFASPATPGGSYTSADVSLPTGTTNPVQVLLNATNIPLGTNFTVKLIPQFANPTSVTSTASTGTFESSTATADINFPPGRISILNAFASFSLPQTASNPFPVFVEGEKVEKIKVAAVYGGDSSIYLITESGREVPYRLGKTR